MPFSKNVLSRTKTPAATARRSRNRFRPQHISFCSLSLLFYLGFSSFFLFPSLFFSPLEWWTHFPQNGAYNGPKSRNWLSEIALFETFYIKLMFFVVGVTFYFSPLRENLRTPNLARFSFSKFGTTLSCSKLSNFLIFFNKNNFLNLLLVFLKGGT